MRAVLGVLLCLAVFFLPLSASSQEEEEERRVRWQRGDDGAEIPITVFHSVQSANLPTAETLRQGEFQFEISHRFQPALSTGAETLWGLDGPVNNRFGLAYAFHDRVLTTFQRSNLDDNWDLNVKVRVAEGGRDGVPWMIGLLGGAAVNTEVPERGAFDSRNWQYYAQGILNALLWRRLAVGVVPSYVHNPRITSPEAEDGFYLGLNGQVYMGSHWSILAEWTISEAVEEHEHDAGTLGIELETGGHFFKIFVTNSVRLNPAQYLPGTPHRFEPNEWRLGFNITRLLRFWGA
jgi:hypothetical protein